MHGTSTSMNRRALLRGAAAGTTVSIALPALDAMFDGNGEALADGTAPPRRFVLFYMGNGAPIMYQPYRKVPGTWVPHAPGNSRAYVTGADYPLSECLQPLASVKPYVRVMSGLFAAPYLGGFHEEEMSSVLSGRSNRITPGSHIFSEVRRGLGGPTVDFVAAKSLGAATAIRELRVGVCREANTGEAIFNNLTYDDSGAPVPSQFDPQRVFDQMFGGFVPPTTASGTPNPEVLRRKSVLDAVARDAARLQARLGAADRGKLDTHLTAVRELETRLANLQRSAAVACKVPARPELSKDYPIIARAMSDLLVLAFSCDLARVASYLMTKNTGHTQMTWLGLTTDHHLLSHGSDAKVVPPMTKICTWHVEQFAYLVGALAGVSEGAGKLIDSTLLALTSEFGDSDAHEPYDVPSLVAGGPSLVRGNYHWRSDSKDGTCKLWLACLQALGVPAASFGNATTTVPLS